MVEPVYLIAEDGAVAAKNVAVVKARSGKSPMIRAVDRKPARPARRTA